MSTPEPPARLPDSRRAWPLSLLFGIGNCVFFLVLAAAEGFLKRLAPFSWLSTLVWMFLLAQPLVGLILQGRGKRRLGRALVFSLPWTIVVYAVGTAGILGWILFRNGGHF